MNDQKQQVLDRINQATNVLVAVSKDPSVDQLTAAIGLTLALHTLDKHATTVFSGEVPSTVEFLKPEQTIEKNTDSLRDFIIALDKSKADKLRYKVEDKVVKIFITPYRTSIGQADLEFSEGDFNVDVVVCLGVHDQADLDQAITSHGRILHDATVVGVNNTAGNSLGNINWQEVSSSSLSEMVAQLVDAFGDKTLDKQIATALLTGIVAETDRFRNAKTSPDTMTVSAKLMGAGADQQLISTKLEPPTSPPAPEKPTGPVKDKWRPPRSEGEPSEEAKPKPDDGTLQIDHPNQAHTDRASAVDDSPKSDKYQQIHIDEHGQLVSDNDQDDLNPDELQSPDPRKIFMPDSPSPISATTGEPGTIESRHRMTHAPSFDSKLTANIEPEDDEGGSVDSLLNSSARPDYATSPATDSDMNTDEQLPKIDLPSPTSDQVSSSAPNIAPPDSDSTTADDSGPASNYSGETLDQLERELKSSHAQSDNADDELDSARDAVESAMDSIPATDENQKAVESLNAQPLGGELHDQLPSAPSDSSAPTAGSPTEQPLDMPMPPSSPATPTNDQPTQSNDDNSGMPPPPPVPPPFMPGQS